MKEERPKAREPERRAERQHLLDLLGQELPHRERSDLEGLGVVHELEGRPAVARLPEKVRAREAHRDEPTEPRIARREMPTQWRCHQGRGHARADEENADLVHEAEPRDGPEEEPEARLVALDDACEEEREERPEHQVEGVHRVVPCEGEVDGGQGHAERREALCESPPAQGHGEARAQQHQGRTRESRDGSQDPDRVAEEATRDPQHGYGKRRVVDVAPVEVVGAGEVVELVAEERVDGGRGQMKERGRRRYRDRDLRNPTRVSLVHLAPENPERRGERALRIISESDFDVASSSYCGAVFSGPKKAPSGTEPGKGMKAWATSQAIRKVLHEASSSTPTERLSGAWRGRGYCVMIGHSARPSVAR